MKNAELKSEEISFYLPDDSATQKLADFFALFSDRTRVKMLCALSISQMCVSDIADVLKLNQTTVSHQLKILRDANAVTYKRDGKILFYQLNNAKINDVLLVGVEYLGY